MKQKADSPEVVVKRAKKLLPSQKNAERLRAVGMLLEAEGDDFGVYLQEHAENMLKLRQSVYGGYLDIPGSARHWPRT